jgi:SAM-dependent methyltransferase
MRAVNDFDRFARYYDLDTGDFRDDLALYLDFARRTGPPILELACGTGRLLLPLAEAGFEATGVDVSPAMLARAAAKAAAAGLTPRVHLVAADARALRLDGRFALVFVALNSLMHFVSLEDQLAVLEGAARHLAPGGLLVVDLFNPDLGQLSEGHGVLVHEYTKRDPTSGNTVMKCRTTHADVAAQRLDVTFVYDEVDAGGAVRRTVAPFAMHYFWRRELELLLDKAGYRVEHLFGSYALEEYGEDSPRIIVVATRREGE